MKSGLTYSPLNKNLKPKSEYESYQSLIASTNSQRIDDAYLGSEETSSSTSTHSWHPRSEFKRKNKRILNLPKFGTSISSNSFGGLLCLVIAVCDWVAMSEVIQIIETDYNHPYFMRYIVNSGYSVMILISLLFYIYHYSTSNTNNSNTKSKLTLSDQITTNLNSKHKSKSDADLIGILVNNSNINNDTNTLLLPNLNLSTNATQHTQINSQQSSSQTSSEIISTNQSNSHHSSQNPSKRTSRKNSYHSALSSISSVRESIISIPENQNQKSNINYGSINIINSKTNSCDSSMVVLPSDNSSNNKAADIIELIKQTIFMAMIIGWISLAGGALWYYSLQTTIAAVNNTIYQSQCVFVFLFSICFLNEKATITKVLAVLLSFGGVAMVSFGNSTNSNNSSSNEETNSIGGILLCLCSTTLFSLFEIGSKFVEHKYFRHEYKMIDTLLFQGLLGITTLLTCWPVIFILGIFEIEMIQLPANREEWLSVIIPAMMDLIFTGSLLVGITLNGAVFMSVGTLLVIPISFCVDTLVHHITISWISIGGSVLIFIGFILIQSPSSQNNNQENHQMIETKSKSKSNVAKQF